MWRRIFRRIQLHRCHRSLDQVRLAPKRPANWPLIVSDQPGQPVQHTPPLQPPPRRPVQTAEVALRLHRGESLYEETEESGSK
jgi:hypothetical protein